MFRYDRPQAGRYRQFWQFDIEAIGDPGPAIDAEIIELGWRFYRDAGLGGVEVHLNSIGDAACRPAYVAELTEYYRAARDRAARARAGAARAQRPAPARFEGSGDGRAQRRGAEDHRSPVRRRARSTSPRVRAHLDALEVGVPARARARPRPRLLHPDGVRVLRHRSRGPATGHRWRGTLRRPGRAARRSADAGHRVRDRPRPVDPRARRDRARRRSRSPARWPSWSAPTPTTRSAGCALATEPPSGGHRGAGRARSPQARQAARGGRARPGPLRGHRRRRAGGRRGRPARPAGRDPEARRDRATSPARSSAATARIGTGPRRTSPAAAGPRRSSRRR